MTTTTNTTNTTHELNLQDGFLLRWDTKTDEAQIIQTNDAGEDASVDDEAIESEIATLLDRRGECCAWDGINDGSGWAICDFRWLELTPAQKAEVIAAAQRMAKAFVDEFNEPLDGAKTDWDAMAWDEENMSFYGNDRLVAAGWDLYQPTLEAETERLCA